MLPGNSQAETGPWPASVRRGLLLFAAAALAAALTLGTLAGQWHGTPSAIRASWWSLALLEFSACLAQIQVPSRRASLSVSITALPAVIGLITASPADLLVGSITGLVGCDLYRGVRSIPRLVFNGCAMLCATAVALVIFDGVVHSAPDPRSSIVWIGSAISVLGFGSTLGLLGAGFLRIYEGEWPSMWRGQALNLLYSVAAGAIGLVTVELLWADSKAVLLLIVPVPLVIWAVRAMGRENEYRRTVAGLGVIEDIGMGDTDLRTNFVTALKVARETFGAAFAEAITNPAGDGVGYHVRLDADGIVTDLTADETRVNEPWTVPTFIAAVRAGAASPQVGGFGFRRNDSMVGILKSAGRELGVLAVTGRSDEVAGPYDAVDRELFSVFVQQIGRFLERSEWQRSLGHLTEREAELTHRMFHDVLTGLPNRALFGDRLEHAVERERRSKQPTAVIYVDLDNLKGVNDLHGHAAGDALIVEVAGRIRHAVRESDTAARLGGDEFAVVLEGVKGVREAEEVAARITATVCSPVRFGEAALTSTASVGVAVNDGKMSSDQLLAAADAAMYEAKRTGKSRYRIHE